MLPAAPAHPKMVTLVLERMCTQEDDNDRYVSKVSVCVPGLIILRSSEAMEAFWHVAHWILHSISPFLDMNAAMCAAFASDIDDP
jgi:hypothetical protein